MKIKSNIIKKLIWTMLYTCMLLLFCFTGDVFAEDRMSVYWADAEYISSEFISVPVMIKNNIGIKAISFDVSIKSSVLEFQRAEIGILFDDCHIDSEVYHQNKGASKETNIDILHISVDDSEHLYNANGELCRLTFKVSDKSRIDPIPIGFVDESGSVTNGLQNTETLSLSEEDVYVHDKFTVKFETNGGTDIQPTEYDYGKTIKAVPLKEEYTFEGWYRDVELTQKWEDSDIVSSDLTLYAKWKPITHAIDEVTAYIYDNVCNVSFEILSKEKKDGDIVLVQLNSESGEVATLNQISINLNEGVNPVDTTFNLSATKCELGDKPTLSLMVWNPFSRGQSIAKMKTIEVEKVYKLSLVENLESGKTEEIYVNPDKEYELPIPYRPGYTFNYWMTSSGSPWMDGTAVTKDDTLYANYTPTKCLVKFYGACGNKTEQLLSYDALLTEPTDSMPGYIFDGWYTKEGRRWNIEDDRVKENLTLYAKWSAKDITVSFNTTAEAEQLEKQTLKYGDKIPSPPKPQRDGCTFAGWYSDSEYSEESRWDFNTRIYDDTTMYAKWLCEVTFDSMGGTDVAAQTIVAGGTVLNVDVQRENFKLVGWYTDDGQRWVFDGADGATTAMKNTRLHARWLSDWILPSDQPKDVDVVEEKWISDYKVTTTSGSSTLEGWTYEKTTSAWGEYGNWSSWNRTQYYSSDSRQVESRAQSEWIDTSYNLHEYHYYGWTTRRNYVYTTKSYANRTGTGTAQLNEVWLTYELPWNKYSGGMNYYGPGPEGWYGTNLYFKADGTAGGLSPYERDTWISQGYTNNYTEWRYRDRKLVYTYHFYKYEPGKETTYDPTGEEGFTNIVKWVKYQTR